MILPLEYKNLFIFCLWLWIISFLYYFNYIKFSPLYLVVSAFIFTSFIEIALNNKYHCFFMKIFVLIFELFITLMVIRKHFFIDKKKFINIDTIFISLFIFFIYLLFLKITLNKTFYEYYFIELYR